MDCCFFYIFVYQNKATCQMHHNLLHTFGSRLEMFKKIFLLIKDVCLLYKRIMLFF